jgi:hypothetical protein
MRKFTKGLLMTFVASAISLGASAQMTQGYFRVINAGANEFGYNYVKVTSERTATLQCTATDAITAPGTVMYLNTKSPDEGYFDGEAWPYVDIDQADEQVVNLRSQGVDACEAVFNGFRETLYAGFEAGLMVNEWGLNEAQQAEILEKMFAYTKMYLTPTQTADGKPAWYLKSNTPSTQPLADALTDAQKAELQAKNPEEPITGILWTLMYNNARKYLMKEGLDQLLTDFTVLMNRIHMGHTYYLSAGYVKLDLTNTNKPQQFVYTPSDPQIAFCNNNTIDYDQVTLVSEIDFVGDYSKWFLEPVVENADANYEGTDYFAVNPAERMKGYTDGKFYTTLYVDFPMKIVGEDMHVWGIVGQPIVENTADGPIAVVTTQEYTDVVPARQGVVVECKYSNEDQQSPAGNCLQPILTPTTGPVGNTLLDGLFFDTPISNNKLVNNNGYTKWTEVTRDKIRVFNRRDNVYRGTNPIGFYEYTGAKIVGNKAFMILDKAPAGTNVIIVSAADYADGISEAQVATESNAVIYDLQGRQVANPVKGIYVVNGKKVVIK